jgi:hypothetical protein
MPTISALRDVLSVVVLVAAATGDRIRQQPADQDFDDQRLPVPRHQARHVLAVDQLQDLAGVVRVEWRHDRDCSLRRARQRVRNL